MDGPLDFLIPRDVAQLGSARRLGRRGRRFESGHPDTAIPTPPSDMVRGPPHGWCPAQDRTSGRGNGALPSSRRNWASMRQCSRRWLRIKQRRPRGRATSTSSQISLLRASSMARAAKTCARRPWASRRTYRPDSRVARHFDRLPIRGRNSTPPRQPQPTLVHNLRRPLICRFRVVGHVRGCLQQRPGNRRNPPIRNPPTGSSGR